MGPLITHWGNLIPSEFIPGVAKESPGPLCRQPKPAGLAVQADSSRQEPVLISSVSSRALTTGTPLELGEQDLQSQQTVKSGLSTRGPPEGLPTAPPSKGKSKT